MSTTFPTRPDSLPDPAANAIATSSSAPDVPGISASIPASLRMSPESALGELARLRDRILEADRLKKPLRLRGGGTKDFYGETPVGELLDVGRFSGIVNYEPTELVVTARCGTSLDDLQTLLTAHGQMLAFEPPRFGLGGTVGGAVAAGLSGPRRMTAGSLRDFMLGAALLPASGELQYFGGQVMKNVAGYDVSRLLSGSMGILGLITEVSLKVLPLPAAEKSVRVDMPASRLIKVLNQWGGQPLPISGTAWQPPPLSVGMPEAPGVLTIRFSGARAAVDQAVTRFATEWDAALLSPIIAKTFWCDIRDQRDPFFAGDDPLWRLSVPSTAALIDLPDLTDARQLVEWGGALRWVRTAADAAIVRKVAEQLGGTATLFRGGWRDTGASAHGSAGTPPIFHPLAPVNLRIHKGLKQAFDPNGIFNPGRLYRGL